MISVLFWNNHICKRFVQSGAKHSRFASRLISALIAIVAVAGTFFSFTSRATPNVSHEQIELSKPLVVLWRYDSEQTINLSGASDGAHMYLPLASGQVVALETSSGELMWRTDIGGEISAPPVADEKGVYVASESKDPTGESLITSGVVRLIGRDTGVTLWARPLSTAPATSIAMNVDTVFAGASDGRIYALRKSTGDVIWSKQVDSGITSDVTLVGNMIYVGSEFGNVYALQQRTGKLVWHYQTRGAIHGRFGFSDGTIYFGSADGYVYAINEVNGKKRWRTRTGASVQSVLTVREGLLATSFDNFVYFLSLTNGNRLWKRQLAGRIAAEPIATSDGVLFTPLSGDNGVVLNPKDGKQLNSVFLGNDSSTAASPIISGEILMVTTRHGLVAFSHPKSDGP